MLRRLLFVVAITALASGGCSSPGGVQVTLDEYTVKAAPASATPGSVTFRARNVGAIAHQFIVLRTDRDADDLPVRAGVVQTTNEGIDEDGEIELIATGKTDTLTVTLKEGSYVLICNIAGHYGSGMRAPFRVSS